MMWIIYATMGLLGVLWAVCRCLRPPPPRWVPPTEVPSVLSLSARALSRELRGGRLSSAAVVGAYIAHCRRVNPAVRAIVEERFAAALDEAAAADVELGKERERRRREGRGDEEDDPRWLLGVPCTIKECFAVKGMRQTSGLVKRQSFVATEDAVAVKRLRDAGAIVIATTNVPEICMWYETYNKFYGTTCNPYDLTRIVGGSSGGEGAAAAAMMSPFGLGSDVGGSIRMPAAFNGVMGLKASTRLTPNMGQYPCSRSEGNFMLSTGPICRYAEDVYPLIRTLADGGCLLDPSVFPPCPIPRPPSALPKRLRVVAIEDLGIFLSRPPSIDQQRAVHDVVRALRGASEEVTVDVINFRQPNRCRGARGGELRTAWAAMRDPLRLWTSRSTDPKEMKFIDAIGFGRQGRIRPLWELLKWPWGLSDFTLPVIMLVIIEAIESALPRGSIESAKKDMQKLSEDLWNFLGEDGVLVVPTFPFPAPRHFAPQRNVRRWFDWLYTALFNAMQGPAMSVPVWPSERKDRDDAHLPCHVQIVGGWGRDALVIAAALHVEKTLGGYRPPPWVSFVDKS